MKNKIIIILINLIIAFDLYSQNNDFIFEEKEKAKGIEKEAANPQNVIWTFINLRSPYEEDISNVNVMLFYERKFENWNKEAAFTFDKISGGLALNFHFGSNEEIVLSSPICYSLYNMKIFAAPALLSYQRRESNGEEFSFVRDSKIFLRVGVLFDYNIQKIRFGANLYQDFIDNSSFINYGINIGYEF